MKAQHRLLGAFVPALLLVSLTAGTASADGGRVVASGLNNPRGIDVGHNNKVLVAEAGAGKVTRILGGQTRSYARGLPTLTSPEGESTGPVNVAVTHNGAFVLMGGGPQDVDGRFNTLMELKPHRHVYADFQLYQDYDPDPADLEDLPTDSNPYGLADLGRGRFVMTDAGNNDVLLVEGRHKVKTLATIPPHTVSTSHLPPEMQLPPELPAEAVPTSVTVGRDGYYYVGELTGFPFTPGASRIWRIAPWARGAVCDEDTSDGCALFADGFTSITGLDAGRDGSLYIVEMAKAGVGAIFTGGDTTGALIRLKDGVQTEIGAGMLHAPADVAVGRHGVVYVTDNSISATEGRVLKFKP